MSDGDEWLHRLTSEPLDRDKHDRAAFSSGVARIDNFLKSNAARQADEDFTKTYVVIEPPSSRILGYHTIGAHAIDVTSLPEGDRKKMPRHPTVAAIYLSIVAVDSAVQKRGLGTFLLADVLHRCLHAADQIGVHFIVLDAIDEHAARLYRRIGFHDLPGPGQERRMIMSMKKVRRAAALA